MSRSCTDCKYFKRADARSYPITSVCEKLGESNICIDTCCDLYQFVDKPKENQFYCQSKNSKYSNYSKRFIG